MPSEHSLVRGGIIQPHWLADGDRFWTVEGEPYEMQFTLVDPRSNTVSPLLDAARLRGALEAHLGHELPGSGLPFSDLTLLEGETAARIEVEGQALIVDLDSYALCAAPAPTPLDTEEKARSTPRPFPWLFGGEASEVPSPDGRWLLSAQDHNLSLRSTFDGRSQPLTTDGVADLEWDARDTRWSPDSMHVAAKRVDQRAVPLMPIVHWLKTTEQVEWIRFPKTGVPAPRTEMLIVDVLSGKQTRIDTGGPTDGFLTAVGWLPDGSELLLTQVDREFKRLDLLAADPDTGATRVILTETQNTFLNIEPFDPIRLVPILGGKQFIWYSERDGWNHLYLYDLDGNLLQRLTQGSFPVRDVTAVDEEAGWVYFTASAEPRMYDVHLYRVRLDGTGFQRLTNGDGIHAVQVSPSRRYLVDTHSSVSRPFATDLIRADGTLLRRLSEANIEGLKTQLGWAPPEEFTVKAADGVTDLRGVLYKPYRLEPGRKYPVIDNIYGGPHASVAQTVFSSHPEMEESFAQRGFVIVVLDGRGTSNRGKAFQDVAYGRFGQFEIPDHQAALTQLAAERPYMDLSRVGVIGISYGGYCVLRALLTAPESFHVGVAACPMVDALNVAWAYPEHYMGLPQHNKAGYDAASCLPLAGNLRGKLLLVHGTSDRNAPFGGTMQMVEALVRAGKPYDLLVLPEQPHMFEGTGQAYWLDAVSRYFVEHLRPDDGGSA